MKRSIKLGMILGLMVLTLGLVVACGGGGDPTAPTDEAAENETTTDGTGAGDTTNNTADDTASEEDTTGDEAANAELIATGQEVVNRSCISCHGSNLEGNVGPSLQDVGNKLSKEEIITIVTKGKGSMPGGLAAGQEEAVAVYLLSLQ
jgi:cytochrome c551